MITRTIAAAVRIKRLGEHDERADRRAYWSRRTVEDRFAEVESLRRMWPELVGDPDEPMARVVHVRALGAPAPPRPR